LGSFRKLPLCILVHFCAQAASAADWLCFAKSRERPSAFERNTVKRDSGMKTTAGASMDHFADFLAGRVDRIAKTPTEN
jgi:hypothetical protein